MPVVIDASAAVAWIFNEMDLLNRVDELLTEDVLLAPPIWQLEVTQAVLRRERRRLISSDIGNELLKVIDDLPISITPTASCNCCELASFARSHQLTSYDATYLLLAVHEQAGLMTLDNNLRQAAHRMKVKLID